MKKSFKAKVTIATEDSIYIEAKGVRFNFMVYLGKQKVKALEQALNEGEKK